MAQCASCAQRIIDSMYTPTKPSGTPGSYSLEGMSRSPRKAGGSNAKKIKPQSVHPLKYVPMPQFGSTHNAMAPSAYNAFPSTYNALSSTHNGYYPASYNSAFPSPLNAMPPSAHNSLIARGFQQVAGYAPSPNPMPFQNSLSHQMMDMPMNALYSVTQPGLTSAGAASKTASDAAVRANSVRKNRKAEEAAALETLYRETFGNKPLPTYKSGKLRLKHFIHTEHAARFAVVMVIRTEGNEQKGRLPGHCK